MILLAGAAWAGEPWALSESGAAVQPDLAGSAFVSPWQALWVGRTLGGLRLEGYGEVGWPSGVDEAALGRLYGLTVDGQQGAVSYTLGRQRLDLPAYPRTLDGGSARFELSEGLALHAAAGWAEHPVLPLQTGTPFGRGAVVLRLGAFQGELGAWLESVSERGPVEHSHATASWARPELRWAPSARALGSLAFDGTTTVVERARVDLGARPVPGTRLALFVDHRQALDPSSTLGAGILGAFAPTGADEAGLGVGVQGVNRDQLWLEASLTRWDSRSLQESPLVAGDTEQLGVQGAASWVPSCGAERWCVAPSWRGATGAGGAFHALGGTVEVPLPGGALGLGLHAFLVPWHQAHAPWSLGNVAGGTMSATPEPWIRWSLGGEVGLGLVSPLDYRAYTTLRVEAR